MKIVNKVKSSFMWMREKSKPPSLDDFVVRRLSEIEANKSEQLSSNTRSLFELPDIGNQKIPSTEHRQALEKLFKFLGNRRRDSWEKIQKVDQRKAAYNHVLTEVAALRSEIIDLKSLITTSERVMAAWMIGATFAFTKDIIPYVAILFLPLFFAVFGFIRFREFQRNVFTLDCYLREIENALRPDGGWVSYFFKTRSMELFFETRQIFWRAAICVSLTVLILGVFGVIEPSPFKVDIVNDGSS